MRAKSGGGLTSNKLVRPDIRTGDCSKGTSPARSAQIGMATFFKKDELESLRAYDSGVPLGNARALDKTRNVMRSGSQATHGSPAQGEAGTQGAVDRGPRAILGPPGSKQP